MTDSDSNALQEQTQNQTETQEPITFTEKQKHFLDEIISKRLGEVKAKHDSEIKALRKQHQKELRRATILSGSHHSILEMISLNSSLHLSGLSI